MGNNFTIFETAVSALGANSQALSIASQNIANVNTPGYSRQRVVMQSNQAQVIGGLEVGRGVIIKSIERVIDNFSEIRVRDAAGNKSQQEMVASSLKQAEALFNEVGSDGLSAFLSDFINSFQDIANDPTNISNRQNTLNKAGIMINQFHDLSQGLKDVRSFIDGQIQDRVTRINAIAQEIYQINNQIEASFDQALTLKDERNVKLKELAELTDVATVENEDGIFQVYIANGMLLVNNKGVSTLSVQADAGNSGLSQIMFSVGSGAGSTDITNRIQKGALKGLVESRDTTIPTYQSSLDELAYRLVTNINATHAAGYDLDGNTGNLFFGNLASSADAAALIDFDSDVLNTPRGIAAAGSSGSVPGGNSTALTLAAYANTTVAFGSGNATFNQFYGNVLARVGSDMSGARSRSEFADNIFNQAQTQREQVSGVALEEEQTNLIKYQAAFQAASRLVSVADNLLDVLIRLGA